MLYRIPACRGCASFPHWPVTDSGVGLLDGMRTFLQKKTSHINTVAVRQDAATAAAGDVAPDPPFNASG